MIIIKHVIKINFMQLERDRDRKRGVRERERERKTDREADRQTDRQTSWEWGRGVTHILPPPTPPIFSQHFATRVRLYTRVRVHTHSAYKQFLIHTEMIYIFLCYNKQ